MTKEQRERVIELETMLEVYELQRKKLNLDLNDVERYISETESELNKLEQRYTRYAEQD